MLTVVDGLDRPVAGWNGVRGRATTEIWAGFEEIDLVTSARQRRSRSHTGKTAADDDHTGHLYQINLRGHSRTQSAARTATEVQGDPDDRSTQIGPA